MKLPESYLQQMEEILGDEYQNFMDSYNEERHFGIRMNNIKNTKTTIEKITGNRQPVSWCDTGFYYDKEERPGKDTYYYAGCYYIQEPSAMTPAVALEVEEGDWVIDLCAAPGGKSTHIASQLNGKGLLVSNDISYSRVKNLNHNLQVCGVRNAVVLAEDPLKIAPKWEGMFDKVLIDAPCSGEGMFRKEPKLVKSWEKGGAEEFVPIQRGILEAADRLLKEGGELVYSTCTYNLQENEENILWFLEEIGGYEVVDLKSVLGVSSGFPMSDDYDLTKTARVWPHLHQGEGHFIAKLRKVNGSIGLSVNKEKTFISKVQEEAFVEFCKQLGLKTDIDHSRLTVQKDLLYLLPKNAMETKGLKVFSIGWLLGNYKKNRFEPSQALANALKAEEVVNVIDLEHEDDQVLKYLKGETLNVEKPNGWHLICVDGLGIGFGKVVNNRLKNKLRSSWRYM